MLSAGSWIIKGLGLIAAVLTIVIVASFITRAHVRAQKYAHISLSLSSSSSSSSSSSLDDIDGVVLYHLFFPFLLL